MKLVKYLHRSSSPHVGRWEGAEIIPLALPQHGFNSLFDVLEADDPRQAAELLTATTAARVPLAEARLLAPIDCQEVWAAGVTYRRSQVARMEESETSASCYDRVYVSPRPELFFKATPHRVAGPGAPVRIRADAKWNVPEPEFTLVLNSRLDIVGYTIGNDMSSRDIEGENPLYLPQAKVYNGCCGLGPCITLAHAMPARETIEIRIEVRRAKKSVFQGSTQLSQMARSPEELVGWLGRDNSFPSGAFLLTGTGVVPASDFTLHAGDDVIIAIDGIGTLSSPVVQG